MSELQGYKVESIIWIFQPVFYLRLVGSLMVEIGAAIDRGPTTLCKIKSLCWNSVNKAILSIW